MTLTDRQRLALTVLADMGPAGCLEGAMLMHGFGADMVAGLVRDGLATATQVTVSAGKRSVYVTKIRITDTGRKALAGA